MDDEHTPGLRERKRRATHRAIQRAAVELAVENGLDKITVEEISRRADVSPRTFFNYFASKDAAVVGDVPRLDDPDSVERFVTAADGLPLLSGIAHLIGSTSLAGDLSIDEGESDAGEGDAIESDAGGSASDTSLQEARAHLLQQHPQLFALKFASMREFETEMEAVIMRRLRRDDPNADEPELVSRARMATYLAMAGMRHAWTYWAQRSGRGSLVTQLIASFELIPGLASDTVVRGSAKIG